MALNGKTALITGASSGFGEAFARRLASEGVKVALAARRLDRLEALANEIASNGGEAIAIGADVSKEEDVIAMFEKAEAAYGPVSIIINNAGVSRPCPSVDQAMEEFDFIMNVNFRGAFMVAREAARRMMAHGIGEREEGRIINITSITAEKPAPFSAAYSAAKAALVNLTKALAREWATKGISVNAISPGYVATELNSDTLLSEDGMRFTKAFPRRRLMDMTPLEDAVILLAGDAARQITGTNVIIDDGQLL